MAKARSVRARGIIYQDGKLFAQRLKKGDGEADYWCTPGGGLEIGEGILGGLHREMIEETGVAPEIGRLLFIQQFWHGDEEQFELFFHIKNAADYETIDLAATTHGELEVARYGFVDPKTEHILPAKIKELDFGTLLSTDQSVQLFDLF